MKKQIRLNPFNPRHLCSIAFVLCSYLSQAQDYSSFTNTIKTLRDTTVYHQLIEAKRIPFVVDDSVAFLYRGKAESVVWMGDFNGWGYDKVFLNQGKKIGNTNIWMLKASFPKNARLDYKILVDGKNWILDPENPYQQWSGVGGGSPNSELRMPEWKEDAEQKTRTDIAHGTVKTDLLFNSKILNYQVTYGVYLPAGYEKLGKLPVMYVTDGYEYMHPQLGNMVTVLDNLIAEKKIKPIAAVFVDHREPVNRSNNRRMLELAMSSAYLDFFTKELLPEIEKNYPVATDAKQRGIMGTSMGGLTATYFAFTKPDVFGLAGIQSPAFWTKPQIYQLCSNPANPTMKISMTSGLINDTSKESRKMKDVLEASSCVYHYREVNEGHSWGNWRNLIDDVLIDLFGN
ncbi:MAG: alpha/beta hydrolase-fold protein [Cyclobacteriaceae bacterium]